MWDKISKNLKTIIIGGLFAILIISFAIGGVGANIFISSDKVMATVGDTEIETNDIVRTVNNQAQQYQSQFGFALTTQQIIQGLGLHRQALQQAIATAAFDESASQLGLRGTDEQVAKIIRELEAFQILSGTFNRAQMMRVLNDNNMSYAKFESDTKADSARSQLINAVQANTPVSRLLAEQLFSYRDETRSAQLLVLPEDIITETAEPEEGDLDKFYEARKTSYMTEAYRSYDYILISPDTFKDQVVVEEEKLLAEYEFRKSEYITPAKREILQVSLESAEDAATFLGRVNAGEDFITVAAEMSDFTEDEINLGELTAEDLEADFESEASDAVFVLGKDDMSAAIEGFAGWNVFKVLNVTLGSEQSFADVRESLEDKFAADQAVDLMYAYIDSIEEAIAEGGNLAEVAERAGATVATVTNVAADGHFKDGVAQITSASEQRILAEAFNAEVGNFLELKDVGADAEDSSMYVLEVNESVDPIQKTFEEVKDDVLRSWQAQERRTEIGVIAEAALARVRAGEAILDVMEDLGGTSLDANNIRRTGSQDSTIAPNIRSLIFSLKVGESEMDLSADGDGYLLATLKDIKPADPASSKALVDVIESQLANNFGDELLMQYQTFLMNSYEQTVNNTLFNRAFPVVATE